MVTNYSHDAQCYNNLVFDIEQTGNLQTIDIGKKGNPSPPPHYLIDIIGFGSIVRTHCCSQTHINHRICNFRISSSVFNRIQVND